MVGELISMQLGFSLTDTLRRTNAVRCSFVFKWNQQEKVGREGIEAIDSSRVGTRIKGSVAGHRVAVRLWNEERYKEKVLQYR